MKEIDGLNELLTLAPSTRYRAMNVCWGATAPPAKFKAGNAIVAGGLRLRAPPEKARKTLAQHVAIQRYAIASTVPSAILVVRR